MNEVATAAAIMSGLGLFFGTVLAVSNRYLRVEEDPRIEQAEELLPGSNCGACGEAGCRAFAESLVKGTVNPGKCTVSGAETIELLANLLGVDAAMEEKRVARLHCAGGKSAVGPTASITLSRMNNPPSGISRRVSSMVTSTAA